MTDNPTQAKTPIDLPCSVSFRLLGSLVVAFLLGCATYALVQNIGSTQPLTFSTPSIIAFVLSVLLAGASIVLAISAIMLGKFSEQAMIKRSDESIRLQNEVFQRTTDALQRIESSTGITEKRLEDIISGRVGDLSEKIAHIASEKKEKKGQLDPKNIEEVIRQSLLQGLREEMPFRSRGLRLEEVQERQGREAKVKEQLLKQEEEYQARHMETLRAFSLREDLKALKMHHGSPSATGDALFDGIFLRNDGQRVVVTTFNKTYGASSVREFAENALLELRNGSVARVFVVLFDENAAQQKAFSDKVKVADPTLASKISLIVCPPDIINERIKSLEISNKALQATSEPAQCGGSEAPEG